MRERRVRRAKRVAIVKKLATFSFLYLMFFTVHFSMITLSKYISTTSGNGTTTVAKWDVSADNTISSKDISLVAGSGTTQQYRIDIEGNSEISSTYEIVISNVPDNVEISLDGGTTVAPTNNTITFSNAGSFQAADSNPVHQHTLTFHALIDAEATTNTQLQLEVIFTQDEL